MDIFHTLFMFTQYGYTWNEELFLVGEVNDRDTRRTIYLFQTKKDEKFQQFPFCLYFGVGIKRRNPFRVSKNRGKTRESGTTIYRIAMHASKRELSIDPNPNWAKGFFSQKALSLREIAYIFPFSTNSRCAGLSTTDRSWLRHFKWFSNKRLDEISR